MAKSKDKKMQSIDEIAKAVGRMIPIMKKYLPVGEYEAYRDFLEAYKSLVARKEQMRQSYQDKAKYHRESTKKWREDNAEKNKAYQQNWLGRACTCEEKDRRNWCVIGLVKKIKPSARQTYSLECDICGAKWKSRASFCAELRQEYD
jgi:hypothetical protein